MGSRGERSRPGLNEIAMGVSGELGGFPRVAMQRPDVAVARKTGSIPGTRHRPGGCNGDAQRVPLPRWCCSTTHILQCALR